MSQLRPELRRQQCRVMCQAAIALLQSPMDSRRPSAVGQTPEVLVVMAMHAMTGKALTGPLHVSIPAEASATRTTIAS